jgi:hypothetical protein
LEQHETGAIKEQQGLLDSGSDCNFLDEFDARKAGLMPLSRRHQEFVTFNGDKFKTENAYDLDISVTDDRGETRTFRQRFYGCKGTGYHMVLGMEFLEAKGAGYYDWSSKRWAYTP